MKDKKIIGAFQRRSGLRQNMPLHICGEAVLLDYVPKDAQKILDLGTGNGRLLKLLQIDRPQMQAVALDFSPTMLETARDSFNGDARIRVIDHDLSNPLPGLGYYDAVVSSFAIHHLTRT